MPELIQCDRCNELFEKEGKKRFCPSCREKKKLERRRTERERLRQKRVEGYTETPIPSEQPFDVEEQSDFILKHLQAEREANERKEKATPINLNFWKRKEENEENYPNSIFCKKCACEPCSCRK